MKVKKWIGIVLKIVFLMLFGLYFVWFMFKGMKFKIWEIFVGEFFYVNYFWIVVLLLIFFGGLVFCVYCWKYVFELLGYRIFFWNCYYVLMIGYVMNLIILCVGEVICVVMLYCLDGVFFVILVGIIIGEWVVDVVMFFLIVFFMVLLSVDDFWMIWYEIECFFMDLVWFEWSDWFWYVFWVFIGLVVVGFFMVVFIEKLWKKVVGFFCEVFKGFIVIFWL